MGVFYIGLMDLLYSLQYNTYIYIYILHSGKLEISGNANNVVYLVNCFWPNFKCEINNLTYVNVKFQTASIKI